MSYTNVRCLMVWCIVHFYFHFMIYLIISSWHVTVKHNKEVQLPKFPMTSISQQPTTRICISVGYLGANTTSKEREAQNSKLGMFYQSVTNYLLKRGQFKSEPKEQPTTKWRRLKQLKGSRFPDLIIGGACGHGIPYRRLSASSSTYGRPTTLVNYYRGFQSLCRKTFLVETLRSCYEPSELQAWLPLSYLFYPAKPERNETELFLQAHSDILQKEKRSLWICKPSDGSKGRAIFVTEDEKEIVAMFDSKEGKEESGKNDHQNIDREGKEGKEESETNDTANSATIASAPAATSISSSSSTSKGRKRDASTGNIAWVVQQYIKEPMLLSGSRKFDIRMWVLVDADFNVYIHKEGVLRTTSVPYTIAPETLNDDFVHLSNHWYVSKLKKMKI